MVNNLSKKCSFIAFQFNNFSSNATFLKAAIQNKMVHHMALVLVVTTTHLDIENCAGNTMTQVELK